MIDREKQARERAKIVEEVVQLSKEHKHLVIELPTSSGKGLCVAEIIKASDGKKKWVVLTPETVQCENYRLDLIKHGNEYLLQDKIEDIICYASVDKLAGRPINLAINECHRISEHRMDVLKTVDFDQIISDSATIDDKIEKRLNEICPFYKYSKSLQEVIDLGILPQPEIICIGITMDEKQEKEYKLLEKSVEYWKGQWEREGAEWRRIRWMSAGMKRKRGMSSIKTERAKELIDSLQNKRFICFAGSVAQSKELGGKYAVNGKNTSKRNQEIIQEFNEFKTNSVFTCMMLREGINLSATRYGVICQMDSGILTTIQMCGRLLRDEEPLIYIIYIRNSQDEKYVRNFITQTNLKITLN